MSSKEKEAAKKWFELCQTITESIAVHQRKSLVHSFDDLRISFQREIAWAWLEWKITATNDTAYFIDLIDTPDALNLISALIRTVDYSMDDDLADKIINAYRSDIEEIFNNQLQVAA